MSATSRINYSKLFAAIDARDIALLTDRLKPRSFKKGENIVVPGQIQRELYFVQSGVQMSFFDAHQKMQVIAFTYSPNVCAIPDSFSAQVPSKHFLTCLTDTEMDAITYEDLQLVFDQSHAMERIFRKMTEQVLAGIINRHCELQVLSMEERYKAFCQRSPHLLHVVPHKYIASYLGIDPTNFSKLFNRVSF